MDFDFKKIYSNLNRLICYNGFSNFQVIFYDQNYPKVCDFYLTNWGFTEYKERSNVVAESICRVKKTLLKISELSSTNALVKHYLLLELADSMLIDVRLSRTTSNRINCCRILVKDDLIFDSFQNWLLTQAPENNYRVLTEMINETDKSIDNAIIDINLIIRSVKYFSSTDMISLLESLKQKVKKTLSRIILVDKLVAKMKRNE